MNLRKLKDFLNKHNIKLYDIQYRILSSLIEKKNIQKGGSNDKLSELSNILGNNTCEISYNINQILKI